MADNVNIKDATQTTVTIATNDLGAGVQAQAIQLLASDAATADDRVPVSATNGVLVDLGANNDVTVTGTVAATQSGTWNVTNVSGTVSLPTGAATAAKQPALGTAGTPSADVITVQGHGSGTALKVDGSATTQPVSGTVTANAGTGTNTVGGVAATDAAVSGNPVYVGSRASTATPTAMSADNDVVPLWLDRNGAQMVHPRPAATATLSNVSGSATSVTLIAANTGRLGLIVVNDSTASLYLKYGSAATTTSFTYLLQPGATWELPDAVLYTGIVTGIWSSAVGAARVTELTS